MKNIKEAKTKNIEVLYKNIFAIRESLQDAIAIAQEASNVAAEFGGEISRVITAQINDYLIPVISKYIEDPNTPGSVSPLVTFLDSVPLALTREQPSPEVVAPSPIDTSGTQVVQAPPTLEGAAANGITESKKIKEEIEEPEFSEDEINDLSDEWGVSPEEVKAALYDQTQVQMEESSKLKEYTRDIEMYMPADNFEAFKNMYEEELNDFDIHIESGDGPTGQVWVKIYGNLKSYPDLAGLSRGLERNFDAAIA